MNRLWVQLWLGMVLFTGLALSILVGAAFLLDEVLPPGEQGPLVLGGVFLVGVTLSALAAATLARYLAKPLSLVSQAAQRVANGDLSARVQTTTRRTKGRGEIAQLLRNFDGMAESLERLERERRANAAATAHELRTPLTVLKGRLEALRDGVFEVTPNELVLLVAQADALSHLVEDLRTLSLAEVSKLSLDFGTVDLARLAREVLEGYETQAAARGVRLVLNALGDVYVKGDRMRLRQVMTNLLDNALAFSPREGRICVSLSHDVNGAVLVVRDTGPGIRREALGRVFDRFYQDDTARLEGGSGLGLAIVESLIGLHGGHVEARNHPEGGAELYVTLPRR